MTWQIHRKGVLYTLPHPSLSEAFANAVDKYRAGTWKLSPEERAAHMYVSEGVARAAGRPAFCDGLVLPSFVTRADVYGSELELVWVLGDAPSGSGTAVQVHRRDAKGCSLLDTLTVLDALLLRWRELRTARPQRVAISRFKSGAREGELKFTKRHDEAFRARVLKTVAQNERLERDKDDLRWMIECTASVLGDVDQTLPSTLEALTQELLLVSRLAEDITAVVSGSGARHYLTQRRSANLAQHARLLCVRDNAYAPGDRVRVLVDERRGPSEPDLSGNGVVVEINEPGYREVQLDSRSDTCSVSLGMLVSL